MDNNFILTPLPAGKKSLDGGAAPAGSGKTAPAEFSAGKRKKSRRITPPPLRGGVMRQGAGSFKEFKNKAAEDRQGQKSRGFFGEQL